VMKRILIVLCASAVIIGGCQTKELKNQRTEEQNSASPASPAGGRIPNSAIEELIVQLGDDDWETREKAQKELTAIGEQLIQECRQNRFTAETQRSQSKDKIKQFADVLQKAWWDKEPEIKMRANNIRQHLYSLPQLTKIAFVSWRDGNPNIYVMDSDGKNQTRLTENNGNNISPAWSPDGKKIAFVSNRSGNYQIYVMDSDGKNQTRLIETNAYDGRPKWSPNGKKIVFTSGRGTPGDEIYLMDTDGGNQIRLTLTKWGDSEPDWSPDGKKIVFMSNQDGNYEVYVMDADGKNQIRLTENSANDSQPAWSPILFPEIAEMFAPLEKE